ncbi:MAG: hypothetical protein JSS60_02290 [Verrucomicrobia bacterium]|nr:hypothetical protein [Verrucomicrobiota bacterium]
MLNFLRKHQKIFFIFITAAIVVSFSFFGTYSTMARAEQAPDKEVGKGVCGKPIMQQELAALSRLIENSPFDRMALEKGGMPNFLNDGVVEKDFLSSGLGVMLVKRYFDELKPDLDQRVKKIHHFRPYVHPRAPQISAEVAWARFSPNLLERYQMLKTKSDQSTTETVALMSQLYIDQAMLPPDTLKQILVMQQNQQGVSPDPVLANSDLTLFGFKSMEDWFGPRFISLISQFIVNAAQIAEEKGYEVKTEEVRADLFQNIYQGYQQISRNTHLSPDEADHYYQVKMRALGLDETMLVGAWRKVMLFRRLFEDGSGSVLVDPLAFQQFERFAKENVRVALYQLPSAFQLADFRSMMKFQVYLESIAADTARVKSDLRMPKQVASLEQIEKRSPELIERGLEVEWASISKEDLCRGISVKDTWDWETADAHWDLLKKNFPELAQGKSDSRQLRLALLNTLDEKLRVKVDQFARAKMVDEQPAKIRTALENVSPKTSTLGLRMKGTSFPFPGVTDSPELFALLENAALKGEAPNTASERLNYYSVDGVNFFRIQVLRRDDAKKVLTFDAASKDGTLDKILDKRLEEAYPDVRRRDVQYFQQSNGQWKPYKEVRDQIGKYLFADLLKSIEDNYRAHFGFLPGKEGEMPLGFYSNARMLTYMREAQNSLKANPADSAWINSEASAQGLASQWLLEKADQTLERCTEVSFSKDEMFTLGSQQWSSVKIGERGALAFYFVQERGTAAKPPVESVAYGHQVLSFDARRDMMLQILQKIQNKNAIDFSFASHEERR